MADVQKVASDEKSSAKKPYAKRRTPDQKLQAQLKSAVRKRRKAGETKPVSGSISSSAVEHVALVVEDNYRQLVDHARLIGQMFGNKVILSRTVLAAIRLLYPPEDAEKIVAHCEKRVAEQKKLADEAKTRKKTATKSCA